MGDSGPRDSLGAMSGRPPTRDARHRTGSVRVVFLALALIGLAGGGAWQAGAYLVDREVRVPEVVGLTYEAASARLLDAGLTVRSHPERDPQARPNQVLTQAPPAGQSVRPGRIVALGVNAASEARRVPELVGMREADAVARADAVGVSVGQVVYVHAELPAGAVVRQEPAAGTALEAGGQLVLSVSRGSVDAPFALPDLRGRTVEEAEAALATLGVRHVERIAAAVSFDRPGTVTDQRPAAGAEVRAATPITLVYAVEGTTVVRVPDLAGLPLWRAQLALRAARLELGAVHRVDDASLPEGVVEAVPSGYTLAGSPVAIVLNGGGETLDLAGGDGLLWPGDPGWPSLPDVTAGAPDPVTAVGPPDVPRDPPPDVPDPGTSRVADDGSRIIPFRFDPAAVGIASLVREPYRLRLVVADAEGERVEFDVALAAGEGLAVPVRVVGDEPLLQTYINDLFFQAWRP